MADSKLIVTDLEFDSIRQNLKNFLKDQDQFAGFDFDATNISVILDLLAYNTHYNSYYLNMMVNENFLDSSQLRSTTVSKAKMLGYTPRSVTSARASVIFTATSANSPTFIEIPKYTRFKTIVNDEIYNFATNETYSFERRANSLYQGTIELVQGTPVTYNFIVDKNNPEQKFVLPNSSIDTSTLTVSVAKNRLSNDIDYFQYADNFVNINEKSYVYFLDEVINGRFRVYFGQNGLGKELEHQNYISITGFVSDGALTNDAFDFGLVDEIPNLTSYQLLPVSAAGGGGSRESLDSIKFNAPKHFLAQNRAVTVDDYRVRLTQALPDVLSIDVWGGEDNSPPIYGKVFVALQPKNDLIVSEGLKLRAKQAIDDRNLVSIIPEFVSPDYLYIVPEVDVKYDARKTSYSSQGLSTIIRGIIVDYFTNNLKRFYSTFRYSIISRALQNLNVSVNSVNLKILMKKDFSPTPTVSNDFTINFSNRIYHPYDGFLDSVYSSVFKYVDSTLILREGCRLDDYNGKLRVVRFVNGIRTVVSEDVGTIDYPTGSVQISGFAPFSYEGDAISLYSIPFSGDLKVGRGQIINLNNSDIKINVINETDTNTILGGTEDFTPIGGGYGGNYQT